MGVRGRPTSDTMAFMSEHPVAKLRGAFMKLRAIFLSAALMAMSLFGSTVQGSSVPVLADSGSLDSFKLTNTGISGGVSHLELDLTNPPGEGIDTINGASIAGITAAFTQPIFLDVTGSGPNYTITLTGGPYSKTFTRTSDGTSASLGWNLTAGTTVGNDFFNLSGKVTSVITDGLSGFTFSPFAGGDGQNFITLTATSFGGGATSFDTVISTPGGTAFAIGSGAFSETAAIPEPPALALLGIGITGLLTVRRFLKRCLAV